MGFLAPAVPWIIKGGSMLAGGLLGKKAQDSAGQLSPMEQASLQGVTNSANQMSAQGKMLTGAGMPGVTGAMNYYQTLLSGNRGAMAQATAGPRASITDQFRGAGRSLERSGVRGGVKDLLKGEMARDQAGQTARLTTGMQPAAAGALGQLGSNLVGEGTRTLGQAGNLWGSLMQPGMANRMYARQQGQEAGNSMGGLIFDILSGTLGKFGKKGGGGSGGVTWSEA